MSDNTKGKIETIDKIIIFIICFIFILAILGTIWWVKYKANKELKDIISNYNEIQYSTYKYNIENNKIHFYKDINEVSVYKCIKDCVVENIQSEQFIFDKDDLILIKDDSKYLSEMKFKSITYEEHSKISLGKSIFEKVNVNIIYYNTLFKILQILYKF